MDALRFYDPAQGTVYALDLGTVAPASSDDTRLQIYNTDDTYQAEDVTVTVLGNGDVQLWLSMDQQSFAASISIGDIPPGGTSRSFWMRRVTPEAATGDQAFSIVAQPTSWSGTEDNSTSDVDDLLTTED